MRRSVPRRLATEPSYPALDRRQKFALFGSILGLVLVGFAIPQLMSFIGVRGDVLSEAFPFASAEASADLDDQRGFGAVLPSPSPTPSPSSTPEPTATASGTLAGNPPPGAAVDPTGAPILPPGPNPTQPAVTQAPTVAPTAPPSTPAPPPTPVPTASPTPAPTEPPAPTPTPTLPELPPDAPTRAECSDGIDNDRDLFTDTGVLGVPLLLGDPHCSSPSDNSESS